MHVFDLSLFHYLYLFIAALIAYIIKGIAGFGNTLIMTPLFSFVLDSKQITPVDLLFSIPINAFIIFRDRKNFSFKIVLPLSLLLLSGDVVGALFLQTTEDKILKIVLSLLIIGIAFEMWTRPKTVEGKKPNLIFLAIIGIISGITAGIFGISVLLVAYIGRTTTNRGAFRANLGFVFLIDNLFRLIYYSTLSKPIITHQSINYVLIFLPAVIIGMIIGVKLDQKIKEQTMNKIFITLLLSTGVLLFIQNVF